MPDVPEVRTETQCRVRNRSYGVERKHAGDWALNSVTGLLVILIARDVIG